VVDYGARVRRVTAGEVEFEINRLLEMEEIRPTHAGRPRIFVDHKYSLSLSLSLSLSSFDVSMMQGLEDQLDFESDFGFLLFWFDDFRRVVEWATRFLLFKFDGRQIGFFFFFWFDFRRLDCCCFGLLNLMYLIIRYFPFWVFVIFDLMGSNLAIG